jgi:hypothetical protein
VEAWPALLDAFMLAGLLGGFGILFELGLFGQDGRNDWDVGMHRVAQI